MTISQPLNNASLPPQNGGEFVAKATADFDGGDALIGWSCSAWAAGNPGLLSMELWLDSEPTGSQLTLYANAANTHMALGHSWAWCQNVPAGQHTISLLAGEGTTTDQNDFACATVWNVGDSGIVRYSDDATCPAGNGQELVKAEVLTEGGPLWISADASGWAPAAGQMVSGWLPLDGGDPFEMQVFANNAEQHLAWVGTNRVFTPQNRGQHMVQINADGSTSTDDTDTAHLTVMELNGPVVQALLQNVTADSQDGSGGATIAGTTFDSNGGTLLVRTALSVWTGGVGEMLYVGIQVDGTSLGFAQIYANPANTHMPTVVNDLVVTGISAGSHTLNLMAEANVVTDQNDRVSVLILEIP